MGPRGCDRRIKTAWKSVDEAKQQCDLIQGCTMFWKGCTNEYYYCNQSGYVCPEPCECCILYSKGKETII